MAALARQAVVWRQQIQQQHQAQDGEQQGTEEQQGAGQNQPQPNGDAGSGQGQPNGDPAADGQRTDWKAHSRTWEGRAQQNLKERDEALGKAKAAEDRQAAILKALGLNNDGTENIDPDKLKADRDAALADVRAVKVEAATYRTAGKLGADVDALTDSRAYMAAVAGLDPSAATFAADLETKVKAVLEANPRLRSSGGGQQDNGNAGASSSGAGHHTGGQGATRAVNTQDAVAAHYAAQAAGKAR